MRLIKSLILTICLWGCQEESKIQTVTTDLMTDWEKKNLGNGIELENTPLKSTFKNLRNLNLICQIIAPELDSAKLRDYRLFLLTENNQSSNRKTLATVNKNYELIDYIEYDENKMKLSSIYSHSSKIEHDGVSIEFIDDRTNLGKLSFYRNYFEVFETGKIEELKPEFDGLAVFNRLKSTKKYGGVFEYSEDDVELKLDLRDGILENTYAFKFNFKTPKGCMEVAHNLEKGFKMDGNDSISDFRIIFKNESIQFIHDHFVTQCEEKLDLNIELKKKKTEANNG